MSVASTFSKAFPERLEVSRSISLSFRQPATRSTLPEKSSLFAPVYFSKQESNQMHREPNLRLGSHMSHVTVKIIVNHGHVITSSPAAADV
jgi:hypothetical protein